MVCHCRPSQACHTYVLQDLFLKFRQQRIGLATSDPMDEHKALEEADRRRADTVIANAKKQQPPVSPSVAAGKGPALTVGSGSKQRLFCDGGGLCSPGLWEPHLRIQCPVGFQLQQMILHELRHWEVSSPSVLQKTIARLCTGNVLENPFPEEATKRLQRALPGLLSGFWEKWEPTPASRKQPIDVLALGAFMEACADPDFAVLHVFDMGFRLEWELTCRVLLWCFLPWKGGPSQSKRSGAETRPMLMHGLELGTPITPPPWSTRTQWRGR